MVVEVLVVEVIIAMQVNLQLPIQVAVVEVADI
jgi:hypothetical protein